MFGAATRFGIKALWVLLCLTPASIFAVTVGPLDGKEGPTLAPIAIPGGMAIEELPDTSFPEALEKMGDLPSAALEWQRIAHKSVGALREKSLANAARLHMLQGQTTIASTLTNSLVEENPQSPFAQQALYALASAPQSHSQAAALKQLQQTYPGTAFTTSAQLEDVWRQAEASGKVTQTYGLPQAEELKNRLTKLRALQQQKIALSGAMGVLIPGAGHAYAGNVPQGITVMVVFALFLLAFLSSCRHKHYAYSFLFVIPAIALWFSSPVVAMQIAKDSARATLTKTLATYTDLKPADPLQAAPAK